MAKARRLSRRAFSSGISRPVSRVLYGGVAPTWQPFLWDACRQAPRAANPDDWSEENRLKAASSLFGFAPGGVCRAAPVASSAVRSYRTFSPLPGPRTRRFVLCGTFPGVAPAGSYPAPFLRGARTFLDDRSPRLPGRLTECRWASVRVRSRKMARLIRAATSIVNEILPMLNLPKPCALSPSRNTRWRRRSAV